MSYRKQFSKRIHVPFRVKITYPHVTEANGSVSKSPGSISGDFGGYTFSQPIYTTGNSSTISDDSIQTIDIDVLVDTDQFDQETADCRESVDGLTGSVAAAETAEIASLNKNSKKLADTIVTGFFKQVKSEVSTQIVEKQHAVESRLMHLRQQAAELVKKREQMETDYRRTAARYQKIIDDLDKELENRVKALDMPIYKMYDNIEHETNRMLDGDLVDVAAITSAENTVLLNQIQGCICKKHAEESIGTCQKFLYTQRRAGQVIQRSTVDSPELKGNVYLPVFYMDSVQQAGVNNLEVHCDTEHVSNEVSQAVFDNVKLSDETATGITQQQKDELKQYISAGLAKAYGSSSSSHDERVKEAILKFFNN